jgi:hypothetical protein
MDDCYDNALCECFFATVEGDLLARSAHYNSVNERQPDPARCSARHAYDA